ncbi:hypothetical protein KC315_g46 [Hortaea werneckii]|nr:hypothetical protein KC315_g46 [Hortaea werneckii]
MSLSSDAILLWRSLASSSLMVGDRSFLVLLAVLVRVPALRASATVSNSLNIVSEICAYPIVAANHPLLEWTHLLSRLQVCQQSMILHLERIDLALSAPERGHHVCTAASPPPVQRRPSFRFLLFLFPVPVRKRYCRLEGIFDLPPVPLFRRFMSHTFIVLFSSKEGKCSFMWMRETKASSNSPTRLVTVTLEISSSSACQKDVCFVQKHNTPPFGTQEEEKWSLELDGDAFSRSLVSLTWWLTNALMLLLSSSGKTRALKALLRSASLIAGGFFK